MEIDQFVIDCVFNRIETENGTILWAVCAGENEGYIVLFPDGENLHTYRYPPDVWGE